MKTFTNSQQIQQWIKENHIYEYFDTSNLIFDAYSYDKGELITSPNKILNTVMFFISGSVKIYGIREDGSVSSINHLDSPFMIGDLEFSNHGLSPFFTESNTETICLSLSIEKYYEELNHDVKFLHLLLSSYSNKLIQASTMNTIAPTIEERVLLYFQTNYQLKGIEKASIQLHCSRRQLQRVLKKLCDNNKIKKIGKGSYRLK
ncbi:MAG: cyclic nucleotide-binding domain-containing protein [Erysipelotrichaceae bacterium]|nr:cyclic nucleotide-binding domain-containing protein [Erysipelotrichaceae bacterium]